MVTHNYFQTQCLTIFVFIFPIFFKIKMLCLLLGLLVEYKGFWYYLQYGNFRMRWNTENSWLITIEEPLKPLDSTMFRGLCGNMDGDANSKCDYTSNYIVFV